MIPIERILERSRTNTSERGEYITNSRELQRRNTHDPGAHEEDLIVKAFEPTNEETKVGT